MNVKIFCDTPKREIAPGIFWPDITAESMWGELLENDCATVLNIPIWAAGINYLDEVRVQQIIDPDDAENLSNYQFREVIKRSGHRTVRGIIKNAAALSKADAAAELLEEMGCGSESGDGVVAFDVPPEVDFGAVIRVLEEAQSAGEIYIDIS